MKMYKVVKMRYEAARDFSVTPSQFMHYYAAKTETVYRERLSDVTSAVRYAERANEKADELHKEFPAVRPPYYRVEVTEVEVTEVAKGPRVYPHVADLQDAAPSGTVSQARDARRMRLRGRRHRT